MKFDDKNLINSYSNVVFYLVLGWLVTRSIHMNIDPAFI